MRREATEKKVFAIYTSDRGFIARNYNEKLHLQEKQTTQYKNGQKTEPGQ